MIPRRTWLAGGVGGSLAGLLGMEEVQATPGGGQQLTDRSLDGIVRAIESLRDEMSAERTFAELRRVRDAQKEHLRINGKLPDIIEVGIDVWMGVHDWHIRWQQPLSMGRDPAGRYTIVLLQTVLVLRIDQAPNYVGVPYDNRA